jgi:phosphatidylglycerophosphatase A
MQKAIASWFGTGLLLGRIRNNDIGSGTVGALFAAVLALLVGQAWGWQGQLIAATFVTALSIWSTKSFVSEEGDAGWIVVDEAAGTFVALIGLELWPGAVVAWVLFRTADIFKKAFPGVSQAERLSGPVGVTMDDLVAGLYGLAAGHLAQTMF